MQTVFLAIRYYYYYYYYYYYRLKTSWSGYVSVSSSAGKDS